MAIRHFISNGQVKDGSGRSSNFYMVEYCENGVFENSKFSAQAQNSLLISHKILVMTEKVKSVIESYLLLPDFKSRGQPTSGVSWGLRRLLTCCRSSGDNLERENSEVFDPF